MAGWFRLSMMAGECENVSLKSGQTDQILGYIEIDVALNLLVESGESLLSQLAVTCGVYGIIHFQTHPCVVTDMVSWEQFAGKPTWGCKHQSWKWTFFRQIIFENWYFCLQVLQVQQ